MRGTASGLLCSLFWPTCFLGFYARYVDDLFSLDGVEQPDFNSEFIGPTGTATLARRVIPNLLGWKLDAGKAVTNANVFVALNVQIKKRWFSNYVFHVTKKRVAKWRFGMEKLLVVTLHDAVSSPDLARKLSGCLGRVWPRSAGVPRPVVLSCLSLKSLSLQALAGDA